jgi:hypothetical protein
MALALCLVLAAGAAGTGCTTIARQTYQKAPPPVVTPILPEKALLPDGPVALETVAQEQWPPTVRDWVAKATGGKADPVFDTLSLGGQTYLLIYGGRLPSQGYTIRFDKAEAKAGTVEVSYTILGPAHPQSSAVEVPVGVARIARHDGAVHFPPFPKATAPDDVKLGPVTIDPAQMKQLQEAADNGHQPWRLDPVQVAMEEGQALGFTPAGGDQFRLVSKVDVGTGSGTGEAVVEVIHGGVLYRIQLIQPNGPRLGSIWTINSVSR